MTFFALPMLFINGALASSSWFGKRPIEAGIYAAAFVCSALALRQFFR
jgi:hypothetical protein